MTCQGSSLIESLVETLVEADCLPHQVRIYGYSVGFGGAEGGPPGRGMRDHSEVAALIQKALPAYTVTYDSFGY